MSLWVKKAFYYGNMRTINIFLIFFWGFLLQQLGHCLFFENLRVLTYRQTGRVCYNVIVFPNRGWFILYVRLFLSYTRFYFLIKNWLLLRSTKEICMETLPHQNFFLPLKIKLVKVESKKLKIFWDLSICQYIVNNGKSLKLSSGYLMF